LILVSNATIPITKLVKTACKITGQFYQPYASKYFDAAGFEKSLFYAMKKCVQNEDKKLVFYVSDLALSDHVYADLINHYLSAFDD